MFARRADPEPVEADTSGPWSIRRGEYDGRQMLVRLNEGLRELAGRKPYSMQAGIAIKANRPDEHGLPSPADSAAFEGFEEQFSDLFCAGGLALFAAVITTGGMREFVFYTSDEGALRERFRAWAKTPKSHRVQLMVQRDKGWGVYRRLCG